MVSLRNLKARNSVPWLCVGDFNEIVRSHEKLGGRLQPERQMQEFKDALDECGFRDLGYKGGKFTWWNWQGDGFSVWERLNRAVATTNWLALFPATKVVNMDCGSSDHKPIAIYTNGIPKNSRKPWMFEHMWLEEASCRVTVKDAWSQEFPGQPMNRVEQKIMCCQKKLRWWSSMAVGNITRLLKEKKQQL